jgi:hypothetical protein
MGNYKIEKGVPVPPIRHRNAGYPFDTMAVGDSFIVHAADVEDQGRALNRIRVGARTFCQRNPTYAFTVRTVEEERGKLAVRCWRIEKEEA